MSEERRVAPRSAAMDGAPSSPSFPPVAPATPHAPLTPLAKNGDGPASQHPHVREAPASTASPPREGAAARRRHSMRIPDDEIQRPSADAVGEKPVLRRPSPLPEKAPDSKLPDSQLGTLKPMRIITINAEPAPVIDRSPAPPVASPRPAVAAPTPTLAPPPMAPPPLAAAVMAAVAAPSAPSIPPSIPPDPPTVPSLALNESETPSVPGVAGLSDSQVATPRVPGPLDADEVEVRFEDDAPAAATANAAAAPIGARPWSEPAPREPIPSDLAPSGVTLNEPVPSEFASSDVALSEPAPSDVSFSEPAPSDVSFSEPAPSDVSFSEPAPSDLASSDPAPTDAEPGIADSAPEPETVPDPAVTFVAPGSSEPPRERRSEPPPEVAAEDVFLVEPHEPALALAPPEPPKLGSLPPMRARAPSQPPIPRPKKPAPAAATLPGRPPLVIVPPHVGSIPPQGPDSQGARRKVRFWWEELFNDDFIRTSEKISDAFIKREVRFIEESLGVEKGGALLDLGCGTGRHANELARQGYEVVGFDLSLPMLARAGDEAQEHSTKINFMQGDMREMTFDEQFDGIYCWGTSFGYFEEDKNAQVIDRVHRALKGGGLFLLDVINRDFLVRQSPSLAWFEGDGCVCMDEMSIDFITSRMKVKRTMMLDDGRSREIEYTIRVYTLSELGKVLHEHGFKVREVSGGLAAPGVFFGNESPRVIVLAEKR